MRFVNRKEEKALIRECKDLSRRKLFSLCVFGLRRVGKTRLILESLKESDLYFFVNRDKRSESLLKEYEDSLKNRKILTELESLETWDDFFKTLFERFRGVIVFDEFQNFAQVDKSIFGILQKNIDLNENKKDVFIVFSGSIVGLMRNIFLNRKEPLFGRLKRRMELKPLSFFNVVDVCNELRIRNLEDIITLYAIFGGFPHYYVAIESEGLEGKKPEEIFERFFFVENAVFEDEVRTVLSLEFGKRRGIYYDILTAIANGNTRINEIASYLRKKETALTRQINELVNYFNIVGVDRQIAGKKTLMFIGHPLMNFWFRFFYKNLSLYKRKERLLIDKIKGGIKDYVGKRFEKICYEILVGGRIVPMEITEIGRQWGKFKGEKGKNTYEIDICGVNEQKKEILFGECKWKENVDAEKVLGELRKKAEHVDWRKGRRKEFFVVFAKSFKKKVSEEGVYCFDLKDLGKVLKK